MHENLVKKRRNTLTKAKNRRKKLIIKKVENGQGPSTGSRRNSAEDGLPTQGGPSILSGLPTSGGIPKLIIPKKIKKKVKRRSDTRSSDASKRTTRAQETNQIWENVLANNPDAVLKK